MSWGMQQQQSNGHRNDLLASIANDEGIQHLIREAQQAPMGGHPGAGNVANSQQQGIVYYNTQPTPQPNYYYYQGVPYNGTPPAAMGQQYYHQYHQAYPPMPQYHQHMMYHQNGRGNYRTASHHYPSRHSSFKRNNSVPNSASFPRSRSQQGLAAKERNASAGRVITPRKSHSRKASRERFSRDGGSQVNGAGTTEREVGIEMVKMERAATVNMPASGTEYYTYDFDSDEAGKKAETNGNADSSPQALQCPHEENKPVQDTPQNMTNANIPQGDAATDGLDVEPSSKQGQDIDSTQNTSDGFLSDKDTDDAYPESSEVDKPVDVTKQDVDEQQFAIDVAVEQEQVPAEVSDQAVGESVEEKNLEQEESVDDKQNDVEVVIPQNDVVEMQNDQEEEVQEDDQEEEKDAENVTAVGDEANCTVEQEADNNIQIVTEVTDVVFNTATDKQTYESKLIEEQANELLHDFEPEESYPQANQYSTPAVENEQEQVLPNTNTTNDDSTSTLAPSIVQQEQVDGQNDQGKENIVMKSEESQVEDESKQQQRTSIDAFGLPDDLTDPVNQQAPEQQQVPVQQRTSIDAFGLPDDLTEPIEPNESEQIQQRTSIDAFGLPDDFTIPVTDTTETIDSESSGQVSPQASPKKSNEPKKAKKGWLTGLLRLSKKKVKTTNSEDVDAPATNLDSYRSAPDMPSEPASLQEKALSGPIDVNEISICQFNADDHQLDVNEENVLKDEDTNTVMQNQSLNDVQTDIQEKPKPKREIPIPPPLPPKRIDRSHPGDVSSIAQRFNKPDKPLVPKLVKTTSYLKGDSIGVNMGMRRTATLGRKTSIDNNSPPSTSNLDKTYSIGSSTHSVEKAEDNDVDAGCQVSAEVAEENRIQKLMKGWKQGAPVKAKALGEEDEEEEQQVNIVAQQTPERKMPPRNENISGIRDMFKAQEQRFLEKRASKLGATEVQSGVKGAVLKFDLPPPKPPKREAAKNSSFGQALQKFKEESK